MVLSASACVGIIGSDEEAAAPSDETPEPGTAACTEASVQSSHLRRLTAPELERTVLDLVDVAIDDIALEPDSKVGAFPSNAEAPTQWTHLRDMQTVAERVGEHVRDNLEVILDCEHDDLPSEHACLDVFIDDFGARAFRRPLTSEEREGYHALFEMARDEHERPFQGAIRIVVEAMIMSPSFGYHYEIGNGEADADGRVALTGYEIASRLSYFLWGTMPDAVLFDAARTGALDGVEGIEEQVARMLADPRADDALSRFLSHWLDVAAVSGLNRDPAFFPDFSPEVAAAMRVSLEAALVQLLADDGTLGDLLTSPEHHVDATLAPYFGVEHDGPMEAMSLPEQRPGILSHPGVLALGAHPDQTSPVHRGLYVLERLLCDSPPPPPPELEVNPLPMDPSLTTRERLEQHVADPTCAGCHQFMDPIGLAMESYDAVGRFRTHENGKPIDTSGELFGVDVKGDFDGLGGLVDKLVASQDVSLCAQRQLMRFAFGREVEDDEVCTLGTTLYETDPDGLRFRDVVLGIATSDAFRRIHLDTTCD